MNLTTPDSGQLDAFGEADFELPEGTIIHKAGIPARLKVKTPIETHPGNFELMGVREGRKYRMGWRKRQTTEGRRGGPEIHSAKAHRCVDKVKAKGHAESNAWAICTSSIGKRGVYAKGHGGNANPKSKVSEARESARAAGELRYLREHLDAAVAELQGCGCVRCTALLGTLREKGFSSDPPGSGGRFKACVASGKSKALCAHIGRRKYGKAGMAKMAAAGRARRAAAKG